MRTLSLFVNSVPVLIGVTGTVHQPVLSVGGPETIATNQSATSTALLILIVSPLVRSVSSRAASFP